MNNFFLGTSFNPSQDMSNDLTTETIRALSTSFQKAVTIGVYEKRQVARVYEPRRIFEAFYQALHWQISLQNLSDHEHVEAMVKEKKLARRIFVSHSIAYLSCMSFMA